MSSSIEKISAISWLQKYLLKELSADLETDVIKEQYRVSVNNTVYFLTFPKFKLPNKIENKLINTYKLIW